MDRSSLTGVRRDGFLFETNGHSGEIFAEIQIAESIMAVSQTLNGARHSRN